jgi:ABC-type transporter Mla MlaB component
MLRITKQSMDGSTTTFKLEGKLLEPWIEELQHSITGQSNAIRLDLSALTFADAAGMHVLAELIRNGATVSGCSGYISALLHVEKS